MFFQDISRNFDMADSIFCVRFYCIKKLPETKNEQFLRVFRILAPPALIQPVLNPLTKQPECPGQDATEL